MLREKAICDYIQEREKTAKERSRASKASAVSLCDRWKGKTREQLAGALEKVLEYATAGELAEVLKYAIIRRNVFRREWGAE